MNGFFRLITSENITGIELYPPRDGGVPIDLNEMITYLQMNNIEGIEVVKLRQAVNGLKDKPMVLPLMAKSIYPVGETFVINVSDNQMQAVARFYPPSNGGSKLTKEDVLDLLSFKKITFGIDEEVIGKFLADKKYCTDILIAKGQEPVQGKDAVIEYFFNTDLSSKPQVNEDGSVDFFHLNTINHCKQGELLARLTKAVPSVLGTDVFGKPVKGREVKMANLKFGRNIELSEDGCEITSMVNGHVSLVDDSVFVSDVYEVEDVGTATGNIESEGSVFVKGNVQAGFKIVAKGNVEVRGVVEGADIEAGGDIIISRGMNGMGKGILNAEGRVISKFIENATVTSGAYIETEAILHSKVSARTEINVSGKKGIISGGVVRATDKISCKTLGSLMGADTAVEVGVDPAAKERYQELQKLLVEQQKQLRDTKVIIDNCTKKIEAGAKLSPEQMKYVQGLIEGYKEQTEEVQKNDKEFIEIEEAMSNSGRACIIVTGDVYPGTKITISDASTVVKTNLKYCRLVKEAGDVTVKGI